MKDHFGRGVAGWCFQLNDKVIRALFVFILLSAALSVRAADSTNSLSSVADYARWVKPWADRSITNSRPAGEELKVIVTLVSGEPALSAVTNMTALERLNLAYRIKVTASEITTNGSCRSYFTSNAALYEVSPRQLSAEDLKRLDGLLLHLPDDGLKLPPPGQRIIVQVLERNHWRIRVYDRDTAPPEIRLLMELIANPFDQER